VEIWINPDCSKCRIAQETLDAAGTEYTIRRYLDDPPSPAELRAILDRLNLEPWDITREAEPVAEDLGLHNWPRTTNADRTRWIKALAEHPVLIQRPTITADDGHAVVARSEEALRSVLGRE